MKIVIIAGLLFRLFSAWEKVFWFDEAFSWSLAKQKILPMLAATAADNNPPFYYLFLHLWQKLGQDEFFLRLPSLFFGMISIFLLYKITKNLFNQNIALTTSLIFALSPPHVYFSAEARMYSLWAMLTLAGFYYFLKILKSPQKNYFLLFTFYSLLSLYTQYFTIFFLLALNFFLFLKVKKYKKQLINLLKSQLVIALLFLPWAFYFLKNPHPRSWHISPLIGIPATLSSFVLGGVGAVTLKTFFVPAVPFLIRGVFIFASSFFGFLFLLGIRGKRNEEKNLLLLLVFLPILAVTLVSLFYPIYSPRPFLIFTPYFYILVSLGLEKLGQRWTKILAVISLVFILFVQNFYPPFRPQTLKKATEFIEKQSLSPPIIVHTDILTFYPFTYYFKEKATQFLVFPSELTKNTTDIIGGSPVAFSQIAKKNIPFWSVHFSWDEKTWKFKQEHLPIKNYQSKKVKTISDLEIYYFCPTSRVDFSHFPTPGVE